MSQLSIFSLSSDPYCSAIQALNNALWSIPNCSPTSQDCYSRPRSCGKNFPKK